MPEITPHELHDLLRKGEKVNLFDVRTSDEHNNYNIGGELIPLNQLTDNLVKIPPQKKTIFYCESGIRSRNAIKILQHEFGYENLFNLSGGIIAWRINEKIRSNLQQSP